MTARFAAADRLDPRQNLFCHSSNVLALLARRTRPRTGSSPRAAPSPPAAKPPANHPWPNPLAEQAQAVRPALQSHGKPATAAELVKSFKGAKADRVGELLETLASLGQARLVGVGQFAA